MNTRYTILTTFPGMKSSSNVGDQLIEIALKRLVAREKGKVSFLTIFREEHLEPFLDEINATAAILLPGFGIRAAVPIYPDVVRLVDDLDRIKVPLIPIGANWNLYPGDAVSRETVAFPSESVAFVRRIAAGVQRFSCREVHVVDILKRIGVENALMTGDPAWYDPDFLGKPMHRPTRVETLVFSPPLSAFYAAQAGKILTMLSDLFPQARKYCAFHLTDPLVSPFGDTKPTNDASMRPDVARKNAFIRTAAKAQGFEILELAGRVEKLDFYRQCDLHVGYECHAHVGFFRQRRPSVLIAEDARGVGFNDTFGVGGFDGFRRVGNGPRRPPREGGTSGYCVAQEEFDTAPARDDVVTEIRQFVEKELDVAFCGYLGIAPFIDETYEKIMSPFLRSLP